MTDTPGYILTVGNFDGLHSGHCALLAQLAREGAARGLRTAVLTFTDHPLQLIAPDKAPARLMTAAERRQALSEAGIDRVIELPFDREMRSLTAREFLKTMRQRYDVRAIMLGFNNRIGSDRLSAADASDTLSRETGVEIVTCSDHVAASEGSDVSSSLIRNMLDKGDVTSAARMLGRPYSLTGTVVRGHQIGRTIGFPTANLQPGDPSKLLPADGVYAVDVHIPGTQDVHRGVLNIGTRPTVGGTHRTIEVHIIDIDTDLYGQTLRLDFLRRLRGEMKFDSLDALRTQIAQDIAAAKEDKR